jgi:hypothetical protein
MKKLTLIFLTLFVIQTAKAASMTPSYASYIYNFVKYMSWPAHYQNGDFVIAVLGYTHHIKDFHHLISNKKVGNQNIVLKIFSEPQDFGKCHVLFIPEKQSENIEECIKLLGTRPTVIITEKIGMAKRGSCINFLPQGDKIQFELNRTTALNIGVQMRNDLVKLAAVELE